MRNYASEVWSFRAIPNDAGQIVDKTAFIGGMQMT
jgi:hypothetical protein